VTEPTFEPNIDRPDDLYANLIWLTAGIEDEEAFARQARLILLLANQVGNAEMIARLVKIAARGPLDVGQE
jgi:Protein of unknown function (DUF2783)